MRKEQVMEQNKGFDSADVELNDPNFNQNQNQNQHLSLSRSACSSTSETSKGSGLSLARSGLRVNRVKARERARERTAKERENETRNAHHHPISQNSTFTELLTGGIGNVSNNNNSNSSSSNNNNAASPSEANLFQKAAASRQWPLTTMDYAGAGLLGASSSRANSSLIGVSWSNPVRELNPATNDNVGPAIQCIRRESPRAIATFSFCFRPFDPSSGHNPTRWGL
ncbi:hypothetical protein OIU84_014365 [Salix udensis]|uniref:R domain-containing protein n=1 Tax=Salix udensis TaxID=889485 RepID=A0AAD6JCC2_9ROSI|nr:hypothetical protein OIU84_014365 [Salix udensis]